VTDISPERAQAVAAELANQLILQTPSGNPQQGRQTFLEGQIAELEASILETNEEIARLEQELTGLFSARQIAETRAEIAALEDKISTLQANYANLLANSRQGGTNIITIIDPAEFPMTPLSSDLAVNTAVAAMVGFALAAAGAYVMEYLDQSLRSTQEATRHLNLLNLGTIPRLSRRELQKHGSLVSAGPHTPVMDAYAALRLNVQAALDDRPGRILLVTSPSPEEGKSTIAANLAIDWALSGQKVILVDADLYHPSQQRLFDLPNQSGLTTALVDSAIALNSLIKPSKIRGLWVLTSGPLLPNPTPLLAQQAMTQLLATLRSQADVIIIDTPPATAVVDASILALQADGVLLVLSAGRTKREPAKRTLDLFQQIRAQVLGVTLFNSPLQHTLYRYYKDGYGGRIKMPETFHRRDRRTDFQDATWEYVNEQEDVGFHPD
jgi:capsular exopolysaccharide synthesis family protein